MSGKTEKELTVQVSRVSIFVNIALMAMKFFAGVVAHSGAMIADAVHSASDVFGSFLFSVLFLYYSPLLHIPRYRCIYIKNL